VLTKRKYADLLQATLGKCNSFTGLLSVTNPPPIPTLAKIAYALGVDVSYFFEDEGESYLFTWSFQNPKLFLSVFLNGIVTKMEVYGYGMP
jgi:hypothetical protein